MYNWNIIDCDFIQPKMNLNPKLTSLAKIGFKYIEFVENAQSEESAIYFKENKFGEDVPIKKKRTSVTSLYIFLLFKGTTIWFWGGGGAGTFGRDRLFIFITGSAGKFISG